MMLTMIMKMTMLMITIKKMLLTMIIKMMMAIVKIILVLMMMMILTISQTLWLKCPLEPSPSPNTSSVHP